MIHDFMRMINHLPRHLDTISASFGYWIYLALFINMLLETGGVILGFLPGDTLVVAAAALSANTDLLDVRILIPVFIISTFLGDNMNFRIGKFFGKKYVNKSKMKLINEEQFELAQDFFSKKGRKGFLFHRFIPFARALVPFSAGFLQSNYRRIFPYHLTGVVIWNSFYIALGYFFGNIPFVKRHFSLIIFAVLLCSIMPATIICLCNFDRIKNSKFVKLFFEKKDNPKEASELTKEDDKDLK